MPKAEVTLPASVSSVPTARHFVESILAGWGLPGLAWPATLVISELAANAALHARGEDFCIRVSTEPDGVRLEVDDRSLRPPQQRGYSDESTTGRGLRLVAGVAHEWGVVLSPAGKTVWAVLRAGDTAGGDPDDADVDTVLAAYKDDLIPLSDARDRPSAWIRGAGVAA